MIVHTANSISFIFIKFLLGEKCHLLLIIISVKTVAKSDTIFVHRVLFPVSFILIKFLLGEKFHLLLIIISVKTVAKCDTIFVHRVLFLRIKPMFFDSDNRRCGAK